jgi:hypothetical protein
MQVNWGDFKPTSRISVAAFCASEKHLAAFLYLNPLSITSPPKTHISKNSI